MKPIFDTILFDADATLLDFDQCEAAALTKSFAEKHIPLTEELRADYVHINKQLWNAFELGLISKEDILNNRFTELFQKHHIAEDGPLFNNLYQENLGHGFFTVEGAENICKQLYPHCRLYFATNGNVRTQLTRIAGSGLQQYFQDIFVSEAAGEPKPSKVFFDYAFSKISNLDKSKTLMIGDSLYSDIKGGHDAGIATCWFNPERKPGNPEIATADYEIHSLVELLPIIFGEDVMTNEK